MGNQQPQSENSDQSPIANRQSQIPLNRQSKIVVLMGAPGAGKGTQARLLEERKSLPQISTGDMLRETAKAETPLGEEIRAVQASGKLVSDALVIRAVEERTAREDCLGGYILDGFPRTTVQATMLENLAADQNHTIAAIFVDMPTELLEKRMTGRRICPVCREIYNIHFKPPRREGFCDQHPEIKLEQRADDTAEKASVRLETYERDTRPLLDYYGGSKRLRRVDATRDAEAIYQDIVKIVDEGRQQQS